MRTPLYRAAVVVMVSLFAAAPALAQQANPVTAAAKAKPKQITAAAKVKLKQISKPHQIVIQVDQNDASVMNLALNNATNIIDYYRAKGQEVSIDLVTYGTGLHMLRADTSPCRTASAA
jgi:uncharacterized protein